MREFGALSGWQQGLGVEGTLMGSPLVFTDESLRATRSPARAPAHPETILSGDFAGLAMINALSGYFAS